MKKLIFFLTLFSAAVAQAADAIEVRGDREVAVRVLKEAGVRVVEVRGGKYVLPDIKISAPPSVEVGGLVAVSANVGAKPDNLADLKTRWLIFQDGAPKTDNIVYFPDGSMVLFAAGLQPGRRYTVVLDVDCLYEDTTQVTVEGKPQSVIADASIEAPDLMMAVVTVGGEVPPPVPVPPTPTPTPDPEPTPPAPTVEGRLYLTYVVDNNNLTQEQASIKTAAEIIAASSQMDFRFDSYGETEPEVQARNLTKTVSDTGVPCLVVQDKTGKIVSTRKDPNAADIVNEVKRLRGAK